MQYLGRRAAPLRNALEVAKHPGDDVALGCRPQVFLAKTFAGGRYHEFLGFAAGQGFAAVEDIEDLLRSVARAVPHHEVPRQRQARDLLQPDFARQFQKQDREGDRQPFAVVEHLVHVTVGAIVIIAAAAVKAVLRKEIFFERAEAFC